MAECSQMKLDPKYQSKNDRHIRMERRIGAAVSEHCCLPNRLSSGFQGNAAARAASRRSNFKGTPGLPCAVTPRRAWPPRCIESNTIMTIFKMNVCLVVNIQEWRRASMVMPRGENNEFQRCSAVSNIDFVVGYPNKNGSPNMRLQKVRFTNGMELSPGSE